MALDNWLFLLTPWALGLLGLVIGSFLNVVIHRWPKILEQRWKFESAEHLGIDIPDEVPLTLSNPPSQCPHCGHRIRWFENIPLISWVVLRGQCSSCHASIGLRYPLVELFTAALFAFVGWKFQGQWQALLWCFFVAMLVAMWFIDWDTTLLPDDLTFPLLWAGLIAATLGWINLPIQLSIWGAVAGYMSLWSIYWLFKLLTGKEGMGYGDFKLLAALGAWLGPGMLIPVVLAASFIGAIVGIAMKLSSNLREGKYVPFGPFLAGGGLAVLILGQARIMGWLGWH